MNVLRASKRRKDLLGIAGIFVAAGIMLAMIAFFIYQYADDEVVDESTSCPKDGRNNHYAVLMDATDPFNNLQTRGIQQELNNLIQDTERHDRISIFVLEEDFDDAVEPIISMCNPGSGQDASFVDANPRKIRAQYQEEFVAPLLGVVERLKRSREQDNSPIFEMLRVVTVAAFGGRRGSAENRNYLYIFSDMIPNTPGYSRYRQPPEFGALSKTGYFKIVATDMMGIKVHIRYISRDRFVGLQSPRDVAFWEAYFIHMGGDVESIKWVDR